MAGIEQSKGGATGDHSAAGQGSLGDLTAGADLREAAAAQPQSPTGRSEVIPDHDLIRYLEGYVEDPSELEKIERAIDVDPETKLRFLMIADDFATAGLEDEEQQPGQEAHDVDGDSE